MKAQTLLLAASMGSAAAVAAPHANLELLAQARVSDAQVVLGDIVRLHTDDLGLARRLANLAIGQAPQPGQAAVVQRDALAEWVRRSTGLPADALLWSGADVSNVLRSARLLRGEEIAAAAMDSVRARMSAAGQQGELRVRTSLRDIEIPDGQVRLSPRPAEAGMALRNRVLVWVDVWAAERFVRSFPVGVEIAGASHAMAEPRLPAAAHAIEAANLPVVDDAAVSRGEWAALRTTSGAVSLESRVEVLQDGRLGQRVRVRTSANASGILFAKVVGRGQLELAP